MIRQGLAGVFAAALLAASCGGGDDTATPAVDSTPGSTTEAVDGSVVDPTPPTEPTTPETTVPSEDLPTEPILAIPNAKAIDQTTPTSGGGTRPLLSWEPVDGAVTYLVIVFASDGTPYWSTITDQTETHVGGAAAIPEGVDGPEISEGYSWAVYADDANGSPIASSPVRPMSP